MKNLTLFMGDSEIDASIKQMLEDWAVDNPDITLKYESIHTNPAAVVRLGISELPALVLKEEIIAQGSHESWVLPLLDRVFAHDEVHMFKRRLSK
jgi:hypothetical protein